MDLTIPQWTTGPRLLKLGESVRFEFTLPRGLEASALAIYPRYLERADPGEAFVAGGGLAWLDALEPETVELAFTGGRAAVTYRPRVAGNYIARWRVGDELFYRYFSVIEDDWIVVRFSPFFELEPNPSLHALGIPLDYRLAIEQYDPNDPLFCRLLDHHRHYGDAVTPEFPDTPEMSQDERVRFYGEGLAKVRSLLSDPSDARSARTHMRHDLEPGYAETYMRVGLNAHYGLQEANCRPWLGMPEFPYFASPVDMRKVNQAPGGSVVAHQWDFCGGLHFLGPVRYHYGVSENHWERATQCIDQGMREAKNLAELSGHPAFLVPLYDGVTKHYMVSNGLFNEGYGAEPMFKFVDRYQRHFGFELTKEYKLAFARSIDIADYYRRHFEVTPRTVFVSKTDHVMYDMWWFCTWGDDHYLIPRERIPWLTRISSVTKQKELDADRGHKDPLSCEYILVEDQRRSIRFERESPNPIWWFDYTQQERGNRGSAISYLATPDVDILRSFSTDGALTIKLKMLTSAHFKDYAIALWGVPAMFSPDRSRIETNAKDFLLARNTDNEFHLVLFFDLEPDLELYVTVREP